MLQEASSALATPIDFPNLKWLPVGKAEAPPPPFQGPNLNWTLWHFRVSLSQGAHSCCGNHVLRVTCSLALSHHTILILSAERDPSLSPSNWRLQTAATIGLKATCVCFCVPFPHPDSQLDDEMRAKMKCFEFGGCDFTVTRGDYAPLLEKVVENLQKALVRWAGRETLSSLVCGSVLESRNSNEVFSVGC